MKIFLTNIQKLLVWTTTEIIWLVTIKLFAIVCPEGVVVIRVGMDKLAAIASTKVDPVLAVHFHHLLCIVDHELAVLVRVEQSVLVTDARV